MLIILKSVVVASSKPVILSIFGYILHRVASTATSLLITVKDVEPSLKIIVQRRNIIYLYVVDYESLWFIFANCM